MPNYFQNGYLRNGPEFVRDNVSETNLLLNALQAENIALKEMLMTESKRNWQLRVNNDLLMAQLQQVNFQLNQLNSVCTGCRYIQYINVTNQVINLTVIQNTTPSDGAGCQIDK